jgi:clan AA aspartic protease (TIGR02281 family)
MLNKCRGPGGAISYLDRQCPAGSTQLSGRTVAVPPGAKTATAGVTTEKKITTLTLTASQGMYRTSGSVNGTPVDFIVDTGASYVSLPERMALAAGLRCQEHGRSMTANGSTEKCIGEIADLELGPFRLRNIRADILPNLGHALIGMNALGAFHIEQEDGMMRITGK